MTSWCKSDSGVRQGCPLSPLQFNIYDRELGMKVAQCKQGLKYLMVNKDGVIEEKSQAVFLYPNGVVLMASNDSTCKPLLISLTGALKNNGMRINENKSKVV